MPISLRLAFFSLKKRLNFVTPPTRAKRTDEVNPPQGGNCVVFHSLIPPLRRVRGCYTLEGNVIELRAKSINSVIPTKEESLLLLGVLLRFLLRRNDKTHNFLSFRQRRNLTTSIDSLTSLRFVRNDNKQLNLMTLPLRGQGIDNSKP